MHPFLAHYTKVVQFASDVSQDSCVIAETKISIFLVTDRPLIKFHLPSVSFSKWIVYITNSLQLNSFTFHFYLQQRQGSRDERGLLLRAHSSTFWRRCSPKLGTRTYSCAKRWRWKSIYLSPECRWVNEKLIEVNTYFRFEKKNTAVCETPKENWHFMSNIFFKWWNCCCVDLTMWKIVYA